MAPDAATSTERPPNEAHGIAFGTGGEPSYDNDTARARQVDKDEADTCRICRGEGSADEPLFYPCKCSGSIKYVHQECLMEWLSHTQKKHCELCKTSFRFTKLYHPGMPNRIPTTVFIRRAAMHVVSMFLTWCRGVLVACVWLLLLPWCMRVVWRSLFWVGDGGWSQNIFLDALEQGNSPKLTPFNISAPRPLIETVATAGVAHDNTTWMPFLSGLFAMDDNATASQPAAWTFAKRLLFGFPLPLASYSTPETNQTMLNRTFDPLGIRSPSLLSDVPFFELFGSKTLNRFIIDVLEGQIITLLVVVAFILIFLIREWVVQQQPVINMVALGDNAAVPRAVHHDHQDEAEPEAAQDDGERGADVPIQQAENTDENNAILERDIAETEAPPVQQLQPPNSETAAFPPRSSSLPRTTNPEPSGTDPESPSSIQRPHMPSRDRSFIATGIRRSLEEGNDWSFENLAESSQTEAAAPPTVPNSWDDQDSEDSHAAQNAGTVSDQEQDSEHSSESWQQVADVIAECDSDQVLEGEQPLDKAKTIAADSSTDEAIQDQNTGVGRLITPRTTTDGDDLSTQSNVGSEEESEFSLDSADLENSHQVADNNAAIVDAASDTRERQAPPVAPRQPPQNIFNHVLDWMFGDIAPAAPQAEEPGNDEQIVRNLAEEAPFVPFVGNGPQEPAHAPAQDPEVAAAAAQAGIDINEQEAIEDAEDLEGILELIGMQGPIVGLFQNVLFSAVLISATLACAVWLPYLWGKVVILVMGSPVSLLIKLPLQIIATLTDLIVDFALIVLAGVIYWGSQIITTLMHLGGSGDVAQATDGRIASMSATTRSLAEGAMDRIAKIFLESPLSPGPDYFRLSVNSHAALRGLQNSTSSALNETSNIANALIERASADSPLSFIWRTVVGVPYVLQSAVAWLFNQSSTLLSWMWTSKSYKITFDLDLGHNTTTAYTTMERWTASDRMIAIFAGYAFFALAGAVYLKRGSPFSSSQQGQKIERIISDILQQAGGVLKVILIISIEMLVFPLYCGLLLDLAMLPLFKNATLYTRWQFACGSPWTSGFVHWFIGTCYMFHFALFVSMCRKIMRKGVLYFIRDPDDPTFHPVRDVLERSVTTQLRKIAFSALVYGALVIVCLGGVVWSLSRLTSGVLPIHWTTEAPSLEFPLDLLFYNFLTPVIIKFYKPSDSLHTVYKWCFKKCAGFLLLSSFLFGEKFEKQESTAGKYVRAPASDQVRVPKGQPVFIEVDKDNKRKDGRDGNEEGGVHNSDMVIMVFIPNWFRVRIFAFVVTIWIFMGLSGVGVTIVPLLFGRNLFSLVLPNTVEMNDIHAFSLGVYTLGSIAYSAYHAYNFVVSINRPVPSPMATLNRVATTTSRVGLRVLRFTYVWASLVFAIPFLFAVLIELYLLMPLHAYLGPAEPHVVHLIQDWTLGFLYSRLAARLIFANRQSRPARAFNAVVRDGYLYPNARIATRCFLLPVLGVWLVAIAIPSSLAFTTSRTLYAGATEHTRNMVWRFSFPAVGLSLIAMWASKEAVRMLNRWRLVVRDEVYLIGERLHNFGEKKAPMQSRATEEAITAASQAAGPEGAVVNVR
ncbi:RING finger membrane protein [Setomelanomma holmii]|uniref:RING-type E3 ubiquitin transferase n=1 Tax=Setomelanomma holmii TaxID=210430 RepID=A0A9P4LPX8_9PLEO|nr:RING finger membrane protein [Setomelanomma holmii]